MNKKEFPKEVFEALNSYDVNLQFIHSWYQGVVDSLKLIKKRAGDIKHPRHLGDFLEDEISKVLKNLLPQRYLVDKGFLLNDFSGVSSEQDLLVVDTSLGSAICKTEGVGYYPVESAIGTIEVKSNLDLSELRKCLISCAKAKKLFFPTFRYVDEKDKRFFYAIFAYTSGCKTKSFQHELAACLELIPEALRPNLIYILDQGLYLPTTLNGEIYLDLESIQRTTESYKIIENSANENAESQNITLFFSLLIEHAFQQSSVRKPTKYSSYSLTPSMWKTHLEKTRNLEVPVRKFINPYTRWSSKMASELLVIFEEKCAKCGVAYKFYVLPPGTKNTRSKIEGDLQAKGCIPKPINNWHSCSCGEKIKIDES